MNVRYVERWDYARQWANFWRVWWHCLVRLWRWGDLGAHRMVEIRLARIAIGFGFKWHYCTCAYLAEQVPEGWRIGAISEDQTKP